MVPDFARSIAGYAGAAGPRFSICTLVSRPAEYAEMANSFVAGGFSTDDCEYLFADNTSGNTFDGFSGLNAFISAARGQHIIIAHQDVVLIGDGRRELELKLAELSALDPLWAVCGNAGSTRTGDLVLRISDPHGENLSLGTFPGEVTALDENFLVVRRAANLGLNPHLQGFHLYASELCANAASLGLRSYVIDFHLRHKSPGVLKQDFYKVRADYVARRSAAMRPRITVASVGESAVALTGWPLFDRIFERLLRSRFRESVFAIFAAIQPKPRR